MPAVHRHGDSRACGATTVVAGQSTVFANGQLIAVDGDPNSHGGGALSAATKNVYIGGKLICNDNDSAGADALCIPLGPPHCAPAATSGSPNVFVGD